MATNVILLARQGMNVATWNVNGIRARASQVREWLGRERPDVVCLQELKAEPAQIPEECRLAEYHAYWHGRKGYSGVSLVIRQALLGTGLADLGRAFDPDNDGLFTWWAPWRNLRARNIGWRLDYMLASPTVAARASACVVEADVGTSDHAPVVMTTV